MTRYIITILGRDYNNYIIKNLGGKEIEQNIVFNPLEQKLFDKDVFSYDNNKLNINIV